MRPDTVGTGMTPKDRGGITDSSGDGQFVIHPGAAATGGTRSDPAPG